MTEPPRELTLDEALRLIATLVNGGDLAQAGDLAEQLVAAAPNHPGVLHAAAGVAWRRRDAARAIALQRRLIEVRPGASADHERQIHFLRDAEDPNAALAAADAAVRQCCPNPVLLNALGLLHYNVGSIDDSARTFREAIRLYPDHPTAHRNLSLALLKQGDPEAAVASFARSLTPLGALSNLEEKPASSVAAYDATAAGYDANLLQQSWGAMTAGIVAALPFDPPALRVLDVCCGTGGVGASLKLETQQIVGLDQSASMLAEARAKGCYDHLIQDDAVVGMAGLKESFDLITCSVALYHLADLGRFFGEATRLLVPGGFFVFSVDPSTDDIPVGEAEPGEFAHSRGYLRGLAADCGLEEVSITIDVHRAYPGFWCVFRRP
ncbi:MAG: methyltransferase domain-containing protein [Rhodospirillaceae bacterium]